MGMIYYYHECEGAEARVRCERGEELRGMAGGRYYKNIMNCYLRKEETYPIYIHYAGEEYASPDEAIVSRLDWRMSWMHFICGGKGFFNGQPVQAGDAFVAWVNERRTIVSDPDDPLHILWIGVSGINHPEMLVNRSGGSDFHGLDMRPKNRMGFSSGERIPLDLIREWLPLVEKQMI